jgi:CRISPR-associated endonuclease Csn1
MYESEFNAIWTSQLRFHPEVLTATLRAKLYRAVFFQRPVSSQKANVGFCSLDPRRRRGAWGTLVAQRVRMLQTINILEVRESATSSSRVLRTDERLRLVDKLEGQSSMTWPAVRKLLKLPSSARFNLEDDKRPKLIGNTTSSRIAAVIPLRWMTLSEAERESLVTDLLTIENVEPLRRRLAEYWSLDETSVDGLSTIELESGYARLSTPAMRRLLPFLAKGLNYHDACQAAGYLRPDQREIAVLDRLPEPPDVPNPIVRKALFQVRRLVNAILREYGRPDTFRVELARDLRLSPRQRDEVKRRQAKETKARDAARIALKAEWPQFKDREPRRDDVDQYLLWRETGEICIYSGRTIPRSMLFTSEVHVDHILPYSRTLDDSYMNKTLCHADVNVHEKGKKSPWEAWHGNPERFHEILVRARTLPSPKQRRFQTENLEDEQGMVSRLLNDTRYISTEVRRYLQRLGSPVEISKGGATAALRHRWGLNHFLSDTGQKNRSDHRHHAIDAAVIALTDYRLLARISRESARTDDATLWRRELEVDPLPGEFEASLKDRIDTLIVSHEADRSIRGALHESTAYGYIESSGEFVYRRSLDLEMKPSEMARIRDPIVRRLIEERLAKHGGRWKDAFATPLVHTNRRTRIRSVRVTAQLSPGSVHLRSRDGRKQTGYKFGSNHHIEIVEEISTGKWKGIVVTMLEAANRTRRLRLPAVERDHGPEHRFVMSLGIDEAVLLCDSDFPRVYRVQKVSAGEYPELSLRRIEIAVTDDKTGVIRSKVNPLRERGARKVTVDFLGRVADAND